MITKPLNLSINEHFLKITEDNCEKELLKELKGKILLLEQYKNYALTFYCDVLYYLDLNKTRYIVFGYDLEGYFVINKKDGYVFYLCNGDNKDKEFSLRFCNSNINHFIAFNNLFIYAVLKHDVKSKDISPGHNEHNKIDIANALETYYRECEPASMDENNFWEIRTYELNDGFYPTNDAQIKFHEKYSLDKNKI